jgi:hypothetical protein
MFTANSSGIAIDTITPADIVWAEGRIALEIRY